MRIGIGPDMQLFSRLPWNESKDQYRGMMPYHLIEAVITPEGFVGGDVKVEKVNSKNALANITISGMQ